MNRTKTASAVVIAGAAMGLALLGQRPDVTIDIIGKRQGNVRIAVPDFRGPTVPAEVNQVFNSTLWNDLESAGVFEMVSKSLYPTQVPQKPEDFKPPVAPPPDTRRRRPGEKPRPAPEPIRQGPWLTDWSQPPVTANVLAFGSTAVEQERFELRGWLYDVTRSDVGAAHVFGKRYLSSNDANGARRVAHEFANDIVQRLGGGAGIAGSRIYFVSNRTGNKEIWAMDYDGANQVPITQHKSTSITPDVSPDGSLIAYTTFARELPGIFIVSLETNRRLTFYNQVASLNTTPSFAPDRKRLAFSSSLSGLAQIYVCDIDGGNLKRISNSLAVEVEPKFNPKTGAQIAFVSGRSGIPQIYLMDTEGANVQRLVSGGGDAVNPAWSPDAQRLAFAWTRGFEPGNYNIFILEIATLGLTQLTHGAGKNEHPSWAPDGRHLVFSSNRAGGTQIWTMLADGTHPKQLTTTGRNEMPVWGVK